MEMTILGAMSKDMVNKNIIFLGAPGAGKGTQAELLSKHFNIPTISTGNIIRETLKSGSELGDKVNAYVNSGKLVPDEIVIDIIKKRIQEEDCENGFILDGFPRTLAQAEALDKLDVMITDVVDIEVDDSDIIQRMSGRRVCEKCGKSYHMSYNKPKTDGICDACAGTLIQRKDDHPETVNERLKVYHSETEPLKEYYKKQGKLVIVEGKGDITDILNKIISSLEA